jgi:hypothetical protein
MEPDALEQLLEVTLLEFLLPPVLLLLLLDIKHGRAQLETLHQSKWI